MNHLVQRMVERRDRGDHSEQRLLQGVHLAALAVRGEIAREHFAVVDQRLVGREQQHIRGAADLVLRVLEAQSRLERDQAREIVAPRCNDRACLHEYLVAIVARERGPKAARNLERAFDVIGGRLGNGAGQFAAIRVANLDEPVARHSGAGDPQGLADRFACDGRRGGGGHRSALRGSCGEVQPEIERIEVAPAAAFGLLDDAAIDEQRHFLLRHAAVRTQRNVEPGQIVPVARGADDRVQTRHDHEVADAVRGQLEARRALGARQYRFDPGKRRDPIGQRARVGDSRRQADTRARRIQVRRGARHKDP